MAAFESAGTTKGTIAAATNTQATHLQPRVGVFSWAGRCSELYARAGNPLDVASTISIPFLVRYASSGIVAAYGEVAKRFNHPETMLRSPTHPYAAQAMRPRRGKVRLVAILSHQTLKISARAVHAAVLSRRVAGRGAFDDLLEPA